MKRIILISLTASLLFILSNCSVQKRLYRKGWNIEWNKKAKDLQNIVEKSSFSDSLERPINQHAKKVTAHLEFIDSIPVKKNIHSSVSVIKREHKTVIPSITYSRSKHINSLRSIKIKSKKKAVIKRHYLSPLISFIIGGLIILLAIISFLSMNHLLGILLLFLGMLLILFSILKLTLLLIVNNSKGK